MPPLARTYSGPPPRLTYSTSMFSWGRDTGWLAGQAPLVAAYAMWDLWSALSRCTPSQQLGNASDTTMGAELPPAQRNMCGLSGPPRPQLHDTIEAGWSEVALALPAIILRPGGNG